MTSVHVEATWKTGLTKKRLWLVRRRVTQKGEVSKVQVRFEQPATAFEVSAYITRQQLIGNGQWSNYRLFDLQ